MPKKPKKQPPVWPDNRRFGYYGSQTMSDELMLEQLQYGHAGVLAVDVETFGLKDKTLLGIGVATGPQDSFWFPMYPAPGPYTMELLAVLRNPNIVKLFHNGLKFDLLALEPFDVDTTNIVDTLTMARLCGRELDLGDLGWDLGYPMEGFPKMNGKDMRWLGEEFMIKKNALDCQATFAAYLSMQDEVHWPSLQLDMELIPVLLKMQRKGIRLDRELLQELDRFYAEKLDKVLATCTAMEFNPGSWQQVGKMLMQCGAMPKMRRSQKTKKYQVATDEEALLKIDHPVARLTLEYRKLAKMHGTYVKPWLAWDRVRTHFHENTDTGRLGSFEPNMQNIPKLHDPTPGKKHRKVFVPDGSWFTKFDYAQQELRILAAISGDTVMQQIYDEGGDLHTETAAEAFGVELNQVTGDQRRVAKIVNFGMVYGGESEEMLLIKPGWYRKFKRAAEWIETQKTEGPGKGYVLTMGGRKMYLPKNERPDQLERKAVNYPIQGTGAEATKRAMLRCRHLDMRLCVHDELEFEGDVRAELGRLALDEVVPGVRLPIEMSLLSRWE